MTAESAYPPANGDETLARGKFFIDSLSLRADPQHPGQTDLLVDGALPTPCHKPRVIVHPPDTQKRIVVEAYSLVEKGVICIQVIQPLNGMIASFVGYPPGKYQVIVNDMEAGELVVPM